MKKLTVGLAGLTFNSENLGCAALAYSFLDILCNTSIESFNIILFENPVVLNDEVFKDYTKIRKIEHINYHLKKVFTLPNVINSIKKCDIVFDFTEGDSFSDIYGTKRFISTAFFKKIVIFNRIPLFLGPQTYGPYDKKINKQIASNIIKKSEVVYSRDEISSKYIYDICKRKVRTLIDVAFALPYKLDYNQRTDKIKLGINISGLLWNNGYTGNNELKLKVNYKVYILKLIDHYYNISNYEIHLIPHVICDRYDNCENDEKAIDEIIKMYPNCIKGGLFDTPIEAKNYIATMDVFTGARMHATIAAFSSYTPVIPFSYSRKFEGLYGTLNYPYCVNGKILNTEEAVEKTIEYISKYSELKENLLTNSTIAIKKINELKSELDDLLCNLSKE